ncbi:hypothetical protein D3C73_924750 [compost metagenome]
MVVQTVPAAAAAFRFIRITPHMAEIIVRPNQRDIIRQFQTLVIERQHFFVRNEGLQRRLPLFLAQHILQQLPLILDNLSQKLNLRRLFLFRAKVWIFINRPGVEPRIMNPPHPHGEAYFEVPVLLDALPPVFLQNPAVPPGYGVVVLGIRIAFALGPRPPLILVAAQQHVTVRGSDHNAHLLRQSAILRVAVKVVDMHSRPDVIRF